MLAQAQAQAPAGPTPPRAVHALLCLFALLGAWAATPAVQTIRPGCLPRVEGSTDLWCPGDNHYVCYKIPSLLRIPRTQTLLAFIEGRKCVATCQHPHPHQLVLCSGWCCARMCPVHRGRGSSTHKHCLPDPQFNLPLLPPP